MSKKLNKHNEEARLLQMNRENDIKKVMKMPEGRRLMFRIMGELCGVKDCNFTGNSTVYFNEGRRFVGVQLERLIQEADLDNYLLMIKEVYTSQKNQKEVESNE